MKKKVMVCVTRQKTCKRLIEMGQRIANKNNGELSVVHIAKTGTNFLGNPHEGEALDYLFQISKNADADMSVLRADDVVDTIVNFAKENKVTDLIMGESPDLSNENNIVEQIKKQLPKVEITVSGQYKTMHKKQMHNFKLRVLPSY